MHRQVDAIIGRYPDAIPPQRGLVARVSPAVAGSQSAEPIHDALPGDPLPSSVRDPPDFARRVGPARETCQLSVRHDLASRDGANDGMDAVHKYPPPCVPWTHAPSRPGGHVRIQALVSERVEVYAAQKRRMGQLGQRGVRAVHTVAPKSIRAWLKL